MFASISAVSGAGANLCSQLKHMCYTLSEQLTEVGSTINQIASLYKQLVRMNSAELTKMNMKQGEDLIRTQQSLIVGLNSWSQQFVTLRKFVIDNMASFFHYNKHESLEVKRLADSKLAFQAMTKKRVADLDMKKLKLFESKNVERWKINYQVLNQDFNELIQSFPKIKPLMIPDETKPVNDLVELNQYLNKHLLFEYLCQYYNSQFYIKENFSEFTEKMMLSN